MDKGVAQNPLASDVGCRRCFLSLPTSDLGLCDNCDAKLERDLIRMRDWEYSAEAFGVPDEQLETLRDRVIREYGAAYELLEQPHEYKPKNRRSKSRATQRKRYTNTAPMTCCKLPMPLVLPAKLAQRRSFDLAVRGFGDLGLHGVFKSDGDGRRTARNWFSDGRLCRVQFSVVEVDATLQQQRFTSLSSVQSPLPIITLVEARRPRFTGLSLRS